MEKLVFMDRNPVNLDDRKAALRLHAERMAQSGKPDELSKILYEKHPYFDQYPDKEQAKAFNVFDGHPQWMAIEAKLRNEILSIPNGPTSTRKMTKGEQAFLTNAFHELKMDIEKNPFHMHGETAMTGNRKGEISQFNHTSGHSSLAKPMEGDRYHLHSHPPLMEPFTSSASEPDHKLAARFFYRDNVKTFVTNGREVMQIMPDSMKLVQLKPNPKYGEFPVAYELPAPKPPPKASANHEAPGDLKSGRLKPKKFEFPRFVPNSPTHDQDLPPFLRHGGLPTLRELLSREDP